MRSCRSEHFGERGKGKWKDGSNNVIGTIHFNRGEGVMYNDKIDAKNFKDLYNGNKLSSDTRINSPTSVVGHEIMHAYGWNKDKNAYNSRTDDISTRNETPYFKNAEEKRATTLSSQINIKLQEYPRKNYYAAPVITNGVLSNKPKK